MGFLVSIWQWLDGNKTLLGTLCFALAPLFPPHTLAHQALMYLGTALAGTGLLHKVSKGTSNTGK